MIHFLWFYRHVDVGRGTERLTNNFLLRERWIKLRMRYTVLSFIISKELSMLSPSHLICVTRSIPSSHTKSIHFTVRYEPLSDLIYLDILVFAYVNYWKLKWMHHLWLLIWNMCYVFWHTKSVVISECKKPNLSFSCSRLCGRHWLYHRNKDNIVYSFQQSNLISSYKFISFPYCFVLKGGMCVYTFNPLLNPFSEFWHEK